jgi:hypothetical protein
MTDVRAKHITRPSLLNQLDTAFRGAANSIYGERGPQRAFPDYGGRRATGAPPESIEEHIVDAIGHVAGLKPGQRVALRNELVKMCQNISFIKLIDEQVHGPHLEAAGMDAQGNVRGL